MFSEDRLFIGGQWMKPADDRVIDVISPATEELYGCVPDATPADIDLAVSAARDAFENGPWPRMSITERAAYLRRMMEILEPHQELLIERQIGEMGGPRKFVQPVTMSLARQLEAFIHLAQDVPLSEVRDGSNGKIIVRREPVGVIAGIIPWNGPIVMLLQELIPVLLTGCTFVVKPAPESPLSAYIVAEALEKAGLPRGVVSIVAGSRETGEYLVSHPGVDKVVFTGSVASGRRVGSICGDRIRPVTLELGGKSAAIVLDDVDIESELPALIGSALPNSGQACIANTRILVPAGRYEEIEQRIVSAVGAMKVGDPNDIETDVGPLVAERQRDRVEAYIRGAIEGGAKLAIGGGRPSIDKGYYVEPTVFTEVSNSMTIAQEEIFGPVLSIIRYGSEEEAIRIANDSNYGLGGGVFTSDIQRGIAVAARIQSGYISVNCAREEAAPGVHSFKQAGGGGPFGGYKLSGLGRRNGLEGISSFYQLKSVVLPRGFTP